jgi:ABC-2 type transport system permease protein
VASFVGKTLTIAELEARKLQHDSTELITRAVQPALWLVIFGEVLANIRAIPNSDFIYLIKKVILRITSKYIRHTRLGT